jgi:hypothetical protein
MILWNLVEILPKSPRAWSRLAKRLGVSIELDHLPLYRFIREAGFTVANQKIACGSSFRQKQGFRTVEKVNWQSTSGSPSFFLPCLQ